MSPADLHSRVEGYLRRAGVRHVDPGMVRAGLVAMAVLACIGIWRWWPSQAAGAGGSTAAVNRSGVLKSDAREQVVSSQTAPAAVVHVVGAVRRPGVYGFSAGDRVIDAVKAAGGLLPDAVPTAINMARILQDGEQVVVPDQDAVNSAATGGGAQDVGVGDSGSTPGAQIDLNSADASALDSLPGIGPSTAAKIIADRESNGPYRTVEELSRVPGIGEKKLAQLEGLIRVR